MKFCSNCGNRIDDNAIFCAHCGARTNGEAPFANNSGFDPYGSYYGGYPTRDTAPSMAVSVISFIFMEIGLIFWLFFRHSRPGKANSALKGTLSRFSFNMPIIGLVLWLLWKNDPTKRDFVKVAKISAIVGVVVYVLLIACMLALSATGNIDQSVTEFPLGDMIAFVISGIR